MRFACSATILLAIAGCGASDVPSKPDPGRPQAAKSGVSRDIYEVRGVVRRVDPASKSVRIAHEEIPGFMARMTMPFSVRDPALLDDVHPGDEVEGRLLVAREGGEIRDFVLTDLAVTKPTTTGPSPEGENPAGTEAARTLAVGEMVPDFRMTTQDGSTLRLSDLRGEVVVLTFIYTRCPSPEFCPAVDAKFADLARRVSAAPGRAERVRLLSVSFDPEHDTPEVLAAHAKRRGARPPLWTFAVASTDELAKVAGPLGLSYVPGTREIDHNLRTAVVDPEGKLARLEVGAGWDPADLIKDVSRLARAPRD